MNFIDTLTQLSLDLRQTPILQRSTLLQNRLEEINRRVRRKMYFKGNHPLEKEDYLEEGQSDDYYFPSIDDISQDMIRYSIQLPIEPSVSYVFFVFLFIILLFYKISLLFAYLSCFFNPFLKLIFIPSFRGVLLQTNTKSAPNGQEVVLMILLIIYTIPLITITITTTTINMDSNNSNNHYSVIEP